MAAIVIAAALGNKIKGIFLPFSKSFRLKFLGIVPQPFIVVGAVEVEKDPGAFGEPGTFPLEIVLYPGRYKRKERIKATHFLGKPFDQWVISGCL